MKELFQEKEKEYMAQIMEVHPDLFLEFPLATYCAELKNRGYYQFELFSDDLEKRLHEMMEKYSLHIVALYQKIGMSHLIIESLDQLSDNKLPENIRNLYQKWFLSIYDDFSTQPDYYYSPENPFQLMRKDLAISCRRAIPVGGAWFIELRRIRYSHEIQSAALYDPAIEVSQPMMKRRKVLRMRTINALRHFGTIKRILQKLEIFLHEMTGKYDWFYVIHTAERNIQDFNEEQMNLAYQNIVALLKNDPQIKGVYRTSWFLDPLLKEISPNLSFLHEVPLKNGADLYYAGPCDEEEKQKAIKTSPVRNSLYQEGRYIPKRYFYFWFRDKVIHGVYEDKT